MPNEANDELIRFVDTELAELLSSEQREHILALSWRAIRNERMRTKREYVDELTRQKSQWEHELHQAKTTELATQQGLNPPHFFADKISSGERLFWRGVLYATGFCIVAAVIVWGYAIFFT